VLRLYPSRGQEAQIRRTLAARRKVWNELLELQNARLDRGDKRLGQFALDKELTKLKAWPELAWLNEVPAVSLQRVCVDLVAAFKRFFEERAKRKTSGIRPPPKKPRKDGRPDGWPVFKSWRADGAFYFTNQSFAVPTPSRVRLPKIGEMRYRSGRAVPPDAKIEGARVRLRGGKWFMAIQLSLWAGSNEPRKAG
jgi:putative transposase